MKEIITTAIKHPWATCTVIGAITTGIAKIITAVKASA